MNVEIKSSQGTRLEPCETYLLADRKVFLTGPINQKSAEEFFKQVSYLVREDETKPIKLFINSTGGEIDAGMMIYNIIQTCPAPISTYCMSMAYSMAAIIFASSKHGRYMLPDSKLMLHEPLIPSLGGNASTIRQVSRDLDETRQKMNAILVRHTGKALEEVEKATSYDNYFNALESIEFNLADRLITFADMI